jgi:hypothetical protein
MEPNDGKEIYFKELEAVRTKRNGLPDDSLIRLALCDEVLHQVEEKIRQADPVDLSYALWPPLYGFCCIKSDEAIAALDLDLRLVAQHAGPNTIPAITQFMKTKEGDRQGQWYGGLFDLWSKATATNNGQKIELDSQLPNGRESDISVQLNGRRFRIESTVLTQDDESDQVWKRYLQDKRVDPNKVLIRPGPYCPPNAKGPSPYYLSLRFYAKVFDKLTQNLNPAKSQFADDEPNVLLVSCAGRIRHDEPGIGWALDELFVAQPTMARSVVPETFTDISLSGWIDFRARELIQQRKMTVDWYCDHSHEVIAAPCRLGAILLFDGCRFMQARINYNANQPCSVTHKDIVELERLFNREVGYWA